MKKNTSKQKKEPIVVSKLTTLEDLILAAMGPPDKNIVNFKMVQAILMILAQQLRMLQRPVDYRSLEEETTAQRETEKGEKESKKSVTESEKSTKESETSENESAKSDRDSEKSEGVSEKAERESKKTEREKEKTGREKGKTGRDKEKKGREKEKTGRERDKTGRENEKTGRKREKTGREEETTEGDKEKKGREREKTKQEREKTGREREEKEGNIPLEKEGKDKSTIEDSIISVTGKDRILVVEKLPASRRGSSQSRVGSIPVVTLSQFKILEGAVRALEEKVAPIPFPSMPDNRTLRDELAKGSASLTGTMEAMQVSARMQAAEEAITRMSELLSDMAAKNASRMLPKERSVKMQYFSDSDEDSERVETKRSSRNIAISAKKSSIFGLALNKQASKQKHEKLESVTKPEPVPTYFVSHPEMDEALRDLQAALTKSIFARSALLQKSVEQTSKTVDKAVEKAENASKLEDRIKYLTALINKRADVDADFKAGMTTQMDTFNGQLVQVMVDLRDGIIQFESTGSEIQGLTELSSKYDEMVEMLDMTIHTHNNLASGQNQLNNDMQGILTCIEMLQEEKSDHDEMVDLLRDKAHISAMDGFLLSKEFAEYQGRLEEKLGQCHGKFSTQETVWQSALDDLTELAETKSDLLQLLKLKEDTEYQLNEINKKVRCLAYALGEPKAALLARKLSQEARCGACNLPAIQYAMDKSYITDEKDKPLAKPPRLPLAYYSYIGAGDLCEVETNAPTMDDAKQHVCRRWVGGSHTLLSESVKRAKAEPVQAFEPPTKKYTGFGDNGKLYNMEETLDPCQHCNPKTGEVLVDDAGHTDHMVHNVHKYGEPQTADK